MFKLDDFRRFIANSRVKSDGRGKSHSCVSLISRDAQGRRAVAISDKFVGSLLAAAYMRARPDTERGGRGASRQRPVIRPIFTWHRRSSRSTSPHRFELAKRVPSPRRARSRLTLAGRVTRREEVLRRSPGLRDCGDAAADAANAEMRREGCFVGRGERDEGMYDEFSKSEKLVRVFGDPQSGAADPTK